MKVWSQTCRWALYRTGLPGGSELFMHCASPRLEGGDDPYQRNNRTRNAHSLLPQAARHETIVTAGRFADCSFLHGAK